ncbi:hypothetical protein AAHE18_18G048600 [Arachis hypogaea]
MSTGKLFAYATVVTFKRPIPSNTIGVAATASWVQNRHPKDSRREEVEGQQRFFFFHCSCFLPSLTHESVIKSIIISCSGCPSLAICKHRELYTCGRLLISIVF